MVLGWPSVAWGLKHISSHEIAEWLAEYSIEPFGDVRGDLQAGIVASTVANVNRDQDKKREPFSPVDFLLFQDEEKPEKPRQTWQQQLAIAEALNIAFGGNDLRDSNGSSELSSNPVALG